MISDRYHENQISTSMINKILLDDVDQCFCCYYDEGFYLQFGCGSYKDSTECKISLLENHVIVFEKLWIDERSVRYNQETCILQFSMYGVCYQMKIRPQQPTPVVQSILKGTTQEEAPSTYLEVSKDDDPVSLPSDSKPEIKIEPKT